jgi:hypothetical protein
MEKIIRSICLFTDQATAQAISLLHSISDRLSTHGFSIQTHRMCLPTMPTQIEEGVLADTNILVGYGLQGWGSFQKHLPSILTIKNKSMTLDLTHEKITQEHIEPLFKIIEQNPRNTFAFAFGFNIPPSSPFFPSASFEKKGFSIGLQSTNLSEGCASLEEWFSAMRTTWIEIDELLGSVDGYLGIDSSVAPLFSGEGSLINFIKRLGLQFSHSVTTDLYTRTTAFIKQENPRPIGLCGLMFPCLEDFELAEEYERGNFSIERNLFLSLHSGLGIDTYPIGIDQDKTTVLQIVRLVQHLSNKYQKPLAIRFVSDGKARIGDRLELTNAFLKDVVVQDLLPPLKT